MVGIGVTLDITSHMPSATVFWMISIFASMRGVWLYEEEAEVELEKKREKRASPIR